ncbi:MAG: carboxylesterase family protein [Kordiimonadaceae bacterium]|jgi:para-nitrobenzyl esterase|nr:carboxylesterase family protein [Kordiimonadaceae bacterium]MBT6032945.1 carboxylesterase family protein [Kordiimonadaceae bacterium]
MKLTIFSFINILILTISTSFAQIVETAEGKIEGYVENGIYTFKGIPYAAPPVGDLRWQVPQPVGKSSTNIIALTLAKIVYSQLD